MKRIAIGIAAVAAFAFPGVAQADSPKVTAQSYVDNFAAAIAESPDVGPVENTAVRCKRYPRRFVCNYAMFFEGGTLYVGAVNVRNGKARLYSITQVN